MILVSVGIVFFMALLALVTEIGRVYHARGQLFDFCDAAALAGAQDLPATDVAKQTAIEYYAKNLGASEDEIEVVGEEEDTTTYKVRGDTVWITTPYEDETTRKRNIPPEYAIEVRACREVPLFFAGLLGLKRANPCGRAVAGRPRVLVIYNGSRTQGMWIVGARNRVEGDIHSNHDIVVVGSRNVVTGTAFYLHRFVNLGHFNQIRAVKGEYREFPDLPKSLDEYRQEAIENGTYYTHNVYFTTPHSTIEGVIFVEGGNIYVTGHHITGRCTLIAVRKWGRGGRIRFAGANLDLEASDGILLAYASPSPWPSIQSAIFVTGANCTFKGLIYTPHRVRMPGARNTYIGAIVANTINPVGYRNLFKPGPYSPFSTPALLE